MSIESQFILKERRLASFSLEELINIFDGGKELTKVRRKMGK